MKRALPYLALGLLIGLGAVWVQLRPKPYFCEAAATPAAYQNEWFYRLLPGPEGWLLRQDDLLTSFDLEPATLDYLERLNEALAAQGVTLIVAAQPPRGVALPAESIPDYRPGDAVARYEAARKTLQDAGLFVSDLAAAAEETPSYFFRRDHHWTPDGANASAKAVARTIAETSAFEKLEPQAFQTEAVSTEAQVGSFGEAIGRICGKNPPAEKMTRYQTVAALPKNGGLFGASTPPVVLAGTSNSAREDLNFAGFLEQASGLEVFNVSAVGGGPEAALEAYLRSDAFHETKPVFLVWEFATLFDIPQDPLFYRQLIPSVRGVCSLSKSEASVTKPLSRTVPLFTDLEGEKAGFLYLELSDLSQASLGLKLSYEGGVERVTLERSKRERNDGKFFLSLGEPLELVTLTLADGASGEVQARVCP